ncbi:bone marrow stromal antigen 2 [Lutra lutra]|uniref:bone marrow stromal antigen 2 n=1 Tax=Lutra lutra TaxID=9657 RepID=UPI001FD31AFA|nr:bone marrow stromal antigen 2 [Lutra lutra]XP_047554312.1 bone marrow stromal antigen 2 [Lutra lutra]XP_047554318.1 bone marrow stromal antigen 2 [Lutra lutra]XP_047554329.1 bone marrow stromal antigen 2 [Lutra lutra]XP_047554336.1 bone marrow stromal antigen 2 [Lutra lutra]XP_047554343.1 bone marrow stromal antigen 2 [Lutra lutra]
MAPTFYHHWPEPVTEKSGSMVPNSQRRGWKWLSIVLTLLVLALLVALIIFAVQANSKACKEGLLAEQECRNVTRLLELQRAQTRQHLLGAMEEAATCNQTVVNLSASLEMEKAQSLEQLTRREELQREVEKLKEKLQGAFEEVERLRKEKEAWSKEGETSFSSSSKSLGPLMVPMCLFLGLTVLLA